MNRVGYRLFLGMLTTADFIKEGSIPDGYFCLDLDYVSPALRRIHSCEQVPID